MTYPIPKVFLDANEIGLKLEIVSGTPTWEAWPGYTHQKHVVRIQKDLLARPANDDGCACLHVPDVYIRFPDGSIKRPDIAIYCREPDEDEQDGCISLIPEAVIEVVSKGYEDKDLNIGPAFYLSQGVQDVVVFNPADMSVRHYTLITPSIPVQQSPVSIQLRCGCTVVV